MRATVIRRTAVGATAFSLTLLLAACGAEESAGDGKAKDKPATGAGSAAKALPAGELEKLALVQGDVKGHKVIKAGPRDVLTADDVTVDKAECEPLAHVLANVPLGDPGSSVHRRVTSEPKKGNGKTSFKDLGEMTEEESDAALGAMMDMTVTMTSLSSYDGKGAPDTVGTLRTAATDCAGGFSMTADGTKQKVLKVTEAKASGGEEAAAWTVTAEQDGEKMPLQLAVVRQGGTVATFSALNLAASAGTGKTFGQPTEVITAQSAKLG